MNLSDLNTQRRLSLLLYGESGAGKSILATSAASLWGPTYIFDLDRKIGKVYEWYKDKPEVFKNVEFDTYTNCESVYAKLRDIDKAISTNNGKSPYATIIFDSWTAWEEMVLEKIISDNPGKDRKKVYLDDDKNLPSAQRHAVFVPTLEDYGIHSSVQSRFILELTALPLNVIVIAHIQSKQDMVLGGKEIGIQATGKLWKLLPKFFDEVHRTFIDRGSYKTQVRSDALFTCNTSLRDVPKDGILTGDLSRFNGMAYSLLNNK